ncbi:MAG: hypothetical protein JNL38_36665 [Myxococcales bacterium]|jgi:hypothetical protein|nr:hypothetical protein [Myxococcales bacterium]
MIDTTARPVRAYLDTCIASGIVKNDLGQEELTALSRILQARDAGQVELATSEVMREELNRIPPQHRELHLNVYRALLNVPALPNQVPTSRLLPSPLISSGLSEDPLYSSLRELLPDREDADHVWQASQNEIPYFITVDQRTLLKHKSEVERVHNIRLLRPSVFVTELLGEGGEDSNTSTEPKP